LEKRFSWYRWLAGGNYFISIRQVIEAEKRIKVVSLLKSCPFDLRELLTSSKIEVSVQKPVEDMPLNGVDLSDIDLNEADYSILYLLSGYIAKRITTIHRCQDCKEVVAVAHQEFPPVDIDETHTDLYSLINRGGLLRPSDSLFVTAIISYHIFLTIQEQEPLMNILSSASNSRSLFVSSAEKLFRDSCYSSLTEVKCTKGHLVFQPAVSCLFNIIAKTIVKEGNAGNSNYSCPTKIRKLTGN
jgi:hypothetical protein